MNIAKKKILSFIIIIFSLSLISIATPLDTKVQAEGLLSTQEGMSEIEDVYGGRTPEDIRVTIIKVIVLALQFLGIIVLCLILFAGFQWMTSGGNEEKIGKAKKLLISAIIGLAIILSSWLIARYALVMLERVASDAVNYTDYVY